jgi:hypothetical protein
VPVYVTCLCDLPCVACLYFHAWPVGAACVTFSNDLPVCVMFGWCCLVTCLFDLTSLLQLHYPVT